MRFLESRFSGNKPHDSLYVSDSCNWNPCSTVPAAHDLPAAGGEIIDICSIQTYDFEIVNLQPVPRHILVQPTLSLPVLENLRIPTAGKRSAIGCCGNPVRRP